MRFFLPDWEDYVDPNYDFCTDVPSAVRPEERGRVHIWDLYGYQDAPVDGILYSLARVGTDSSKEQIVRDGERDLNCRQLDEVPDWLTTLCDSGAWGSRQLPFPPYSPTETLDVYQQLDVDIGVSVDHLILGAGQHERIYLDQRALPEPFTVEQMDPSALEAVDVQIAPWPSEWPAYEYVPQQPPVGTAQPLQDLDSDVLELPYSLLIPALESHPHAVYRQDDVQFRYKLTQANLEETAEAYQANDYSFRLMGTVQGWDIGSYGRMAEHALELGYQYIGIGGVAGSSKQEIVHISREIGDRISEHQCESDDRVETHIFGFAKSEEFDTIGQSGVSSIDSASTMRSAWTGGNNYCCGAGTGYDAIRVRYPTPDQPLREAIERELRGQEVLCALRTFDSGGSIPSAINQWRGSVASALDSLRQYLRGHKHDARYQQRHLADIRTSFLDHYRDAYIIQGNLGSRFVKRLAKHLREDDAMDPVDFTVYEELIATAEEAISSSIGGHEYDLRGSEENTGKRGSVQDVWPILESYAKFVGDQDLLPEYRTLLEEQPWEACGCTICNSTGIDVVVFRGANRNKRRGYHNTHQFYQDFRTSLPKIAVVARGGTSLHRFKWISDYLKEQHPDFWSSVYDIPVVEIGVITDAGLHEWWDHAPSGVSLEPSKLQYHLTQLGKRYDDLYVDTSKWDLPSDITESIESSDCRVRVAETPRILRKGLINRLNEANLPISTSSTNLAR